MRVSEERLEGGGGGEGGGVGMLEDVCVRGGVGGCIREGVRSYARGCIRKRFKGVLGGVLDGVSVSYQFQCALPYGNIAVFQAVDNGRTMPLHSRYV